MYTEEELELLRSDPELLDLQHQIAEDRLQKEEAELHELERLEALDEAMDAPLAALQQRGKLWAEWSVQWWNHTAYERALKHSIEVLAEKLMWVEDAELVARDDIEAEWLRLWTDQQQAERTRYRIICEWCTVWEEQRDAEWAAERAAHTEEVRYELWRRTEGKAADEAEIAKWKAELVSVMGTLESYKNNNNNNSSAVVAMQPDGEEEREGREERKT